MTRRRKLLFVFLVLAATLVAAELLTKVWLHLLASDAAFRDYASITQLRARYGAFDRFEGHRHLGYALAPDYRSGVNRHNSRAFRGDEIAMPKPDGVTRIVFCGGSTTYGEGVPDVESSVPFLVGAALQADGKRVDVVNAGCPGWTTLETLLNLQLRLLDLSPDYVVVCHGINDVLPRMVWPASAFRGDLSGWLCRRQWLAEASLLERSDLARTMLVACGAIEPHGSLMRVIGEVPPTSQTFEFRAQRRVGTYPQGVFAEVRIEQMLAANDARYFRRNLESLIAIANAHRVRVVLLTFAYSREFPHRPYIGHAAVQRAIDETNTIVRELGQREDVDVIDLAPSLEAHELFTDGVHFTAAGNRERVRLLLPYFRQRL